MRGSIWQREGRILAVSGKMRPRSLHMPFGYGGRCEQKLSYNQRFCHSIYKGNGLRWNIKTSVKLKGLRRGAEEGRVSQGVPAAQTT